MEEGEIEEEDDEEQRELELALAMSLQADSLMVAQVEEPPRAHKAPNGILKGGEETQSAAAGGDDDAAKLKQRTLRFGPPPALPAELEEGEMMDEGQDSSLRTSANSRRGDGASAQGRGGQGGAGERSDEPPRKEEMRLMAELGVAARSQVCRSVKRRFSA